MHENQVWANFGWNGGILSVNHFSLSHQSILLPRPYFLASAWPDIQWPGDPRACQCLPSWMRGNVMGIPRPRPQKKYPSKKIKKNINQKHQNKCRTLTHFYWISGLWPNKKGPYEVPKRRIHHFPSSSPIHPIWVCLIGASKSNGSWSVYIMFPFTKGPQKRDYTIPIP